MNPIRSKRLDGQVLVGLSLAFCALSACASDEEPGAVPDPLGVCREMLAEGTLDQVVPPDERVIASAVGDAQDLATPWSRITCSLGDSVGPDSGLIATAESVPADEARKSIARNKRSSVSEGNQCRALSGTDDVGDGVICFGGTGATGGEPGVEVSTLIGTRYYNLRLLRNPEKSWDLTRGEAIALVKEIDENLTRELGG